MKSHQKAGLLLGPLLALIIYVLPGIPGLESIGQKALALTVWMIVWWVLEAVPIWVTALLPIAGSILLNIAGTKPSEEGVDVYANYSAAVVMMCIGVFLVAAVIEKWGLHKRIALSIVAAMGNRPAMIIFGFGIATAVVSMFISNVTAIAMMLPIGLSLVTSLNMEKNCGFAKAMVLEMAFAASIGGMGTIIGSGTNLSGIGLMKELAGIDVTFVEWLKIGLPFVIILMPLTTFVLCKVFKVSDINLGNVTTIKEELHALGKMSRGEITAAIAVIFTILGFVFRSKLQIIFPLLSDEGFGLLMGVALFVIPVDFKNGVFLMDNKTAMTQISWSTYLLLGGALSLGSIFTTSGIAAWIAGGLGFLNGMPEIIIIMIIALLTAVITECCSNFVVVSAFLPAIFGLAVSLGLEPMLLMMAVTLSGSFAFMLPTGTPTNAIAFSSGSIEIKDMLKVGIIIKLIAVVLLPVVFYLIAKPMTTLF